jgi:hypothetical protein
VPPIDPCRRVLELPALRPNVYRVEWERIMLVPKPGIPYENRGDVTLWVNGAVITAIDKIRPFPEVEGFETIVAWTNDGWLGGGIPLVMIVIEEI